jgi:hypothetical protein
MVCAPDVPSRLWAYFTSALMCLLYVGSLYLLPKRIRKLHRNDATQIMSRSFAVAVATCICFTIMRFAIVQSTCSNPLREALALVGIRTGSVSSLLHALILMHFLYLGPIATVLLESDLTRTKKVVFSRGGYITTAHAHQSFLRALRNVLADKFDKVGVIARNLVQHLSLDLRELACECLFSRCL